MTKWDVLLVGGPNGGEMHRISGNFQAYALHMRARSGPLEIPRQPGEDLLQVSYRYRRSINMSEGGRIYHHIYEPDERAAPQPIPETALCPRCDHQRRRHRPHGDAAAGVCRWVCVMSTGSQACRCRVACSGVAGEGHEHGWADLGGTPPE